MKSKRLLVGNWKMFLGAAESEKLAKQIADFSKSLKRTAAWVAPSSPFIRAVSAIAKGSNLQVGAQNVHWEGQGAFTGEVSLSSIRDCGGSFSIVGHSERRSLCYETSEMVAQRMAFALKSDFRVIVCVGETFDERTAGNTNIVLSSQLEPLLSNLEAAHIENLCLAYEPVWAIGTGRFPTNAEIEEAHSFIAAQFQEKTGSAPCILYGGSVTPENFEGILSVPLVHGALVGRASLNFEQFSALCRIAEG